jgi:branched-chain amino acid transport system ATP-binding protein
MLRLENVTVHYGRVAAVKGITLSVEEGEVVGVVGPNGAGKSTTLNAIMGAVPPSGGDIVFDGTSIVGEVPERLVRRGIALVPEGRRIFGTLTVGENLHLGTTSRADKASVAEDLERIFARFPILKTYAKTPAGRLSGGEQQQLAIARALIGRPRLILLDEPSLGLAPFMIDLVFETLRELKEEGRTILLVEQAAARAVAFADRSYVLNTGRIILEGSREELAGKADFAKAYLGGVGA